MSLRIGSEILCEIEKKTSIVHNEHFICCPTAHLHIWNESPPVLFRYCNSKSKNMSKYTTSGGALISVAINCVY